jgi:GT2 family glycosyltransferase
MKLVIASATRQPTAEAFHRNTWLGRSLAKLSRLAPEPAKVALALDSTTGLPEFYNSVLDANEDADAVLFVHDDLAIIDTFFFEKLRMALDEFAVVGLCGSRTPKDEAHSAWFSKDNSPSGQIGTSIKPTDEAVLSCNICSFGATPARSAEMDGVFIAVDPKRIDGLRFDTRFLYHHYDVDFTLSADKAGIKVGTWPIFCIHVSNEGDGYHSRSFRESTERFVEKWSNPRKEAA